MVPTGSWVRTPAFQGSHDVFTNSNVDVVYRFTERCVPQVDISCSPRQVKRQFPVTRSSPLIIIGDDGLTEYTWRTTRPSSSRRKGTSPAVLQQPGEAELTDVVKDRFRIYFPTKETVIGSKGGSMVSYYLFPRASIAAN